MVEFIAFFLCGIMFTDLLLCQYIMYRFVYASQVGGPQIIGQSLTQLSRGTRLASGKGKQINTVSYLCVPSSDCF